MVTTMEQFSLESFQSTSNNFDAAARGEQGTDEGVEFSGFDAFMMFISMTSVQIGLVQHVIAFGVLFNDKKIKDNGNGVSGCGKCIKYGSYVCGCIVFIFMIIMIVTVITTLQFIASFDDSF